MTTGPSDDISKVTQMARAMVTRYGMSERLGPRTFGRKEELIFLGREISEQRDYSEKVAEEIDEEVRRIIEEAHVVARKLITENLDKLDRLAMRLIEDETLEGEQLMAVLSGKPPAEPPSIAPPAASEPPDEEVVPEDELHAPKPRTTPKPGLAWGSASQPSGGLDAP
jgi:cell division protease FtsH